MSFFKLQGLEEWSTSNVVDWMAALNLYRYAELFRDRGINGKDLLAMDEEKLNVSETLQSQWVAVQITHNNRQRYYFSGFGGGSVTLCQVS